MDIAEEIDARGLICPLPVLRLRKRLQAHGPGAVVRIMTTDPVAVVDIPHFCAEEGHEILSREDREGEHGWTIRKGPVR
ncbi:MAG: sulfurtransferase TusA family protein [Rubricella sp.]